MRHWTAEGKMVLISLLMLVSSRIPAQDFYVNPERGFQGETLVVEIIAEGNIFFSNPFEVQFTPASGIQVGDIDFAEGDNPSATYRFFVPLSVSTTAAPGMRSIDINDAVDIYTANNVFEVLCATCGSIVSVTPTSGMVGESLAIMVIGERTHFASDQSSLSFSGSGIQINSITVLEETALRAELTISPNATPGKRNVSVTTGPEEATGSTLFEVTELPPIEISPSAGEQGDTMYDCSITGGPGGYSSSATVSLGDDIAVGAVTANAAGDTLTVSSITIDVDALIGPRDVTVLRDGETLTGIDAFRVDIGPATTVDAIIPASADRGHPGFPVAVTGSNVRFNEQDGNLRLSGGTASGLAEQPLDSHRLAAELYIGDNTTEGAHDVLIDLCPQGRANRYCQTLPALVGAFEVTTPGAITITEPLPAVVNAGGARTITLRVTDCPLDQDSTSLRIEPIDGITTSSLTVVDSSHLSAVVQVNATALGSYRTLKVVTGPEVAFGTNVLKIFNPQIIGVIPSKAHHNTASLKVTIRGNDLPFDAQATVSFSGDGVTVSDIMFDPLEPNQISCRIAIAADATPGNRDVTVTAGSYTVTAAKIFYIFYPPDNYNPSNGCSCGNGQGNPLWLGGCVVVLALLWHRRRR